MRDERNINDCTFSLPPTAVTSISTPTDEGIRIRTSLLLSLREKRGNAKPPGRIGAKNGSSYDRRILTSISQIC